MMAIVRHSNKHWRNSDLGILYLFLLIPAVIGQLVFDALAEGTDSFHGAGLALCDRPSTGESFFASQLDSDGVHYLVQCSD